MTVKTVKSDDYWLGWREGKRDAQRDFEQAEKEKYEQIMLLRASKKFNVKESHAYNVGFENGFAEAKRQFLALLVEQREPLAKWLFERSSHALRDKITFEQAPEVTKDYWSKQANDLLILLEERLK